MQLSSIEVVKNYNLTIDVTRNKMNIRSFVLLAILTNFLFASINVVTSIAPQKSLIDSIGGKNVNCTYMIPAGASPHSYEPKPSQMIAISSAKAYFTVGVEFEEAWMGRFRSQNRQMMIINTVTGIKKIKMAAHHDEDEHGHAHHENELIHMSGQIRPTS